MTSPTNTAWPCWGMASTKASHQGNRERNNSGVLCMLAEVELFQESDPAPCMPLERMTLSATGLPEDLLLDLILKTIYQRGPQTGFQLADNIRLPLTTIQEILAEQRRLHVLEVLGSDRTAFGDGAYIYQLTESGRDRAAKAF